MRRFPSAGLGLLFVALPAWGQTADIQKNTEAALQKARLQKAAVAYLEKLQQPDGGFAADAGQAKSGASATNAAVRAIQYFGGEVPHKSACADFVKGCFDKESGGCADQPGGKVTVNTTSVGVLAAAELGVPREAFEAGAVKYLGDDVKTFEEIRIAAAAFEALGKRPAQADAWLEEIAKLRNDEGSYGKGDKAARETGSAVAAVLRLGGKVERPDGAVKAMQAGQRPDGGFGEDAAAPSELGTSYRVMRSLHMLKAAPQDAGRLRAFIDSCRNDDGGYGVAKGKPSSASGTYYAASILHWLDEKWVRMAATAYLALGSNLGDRRANLDLALAALRGRPGVQVVRVSSFYETAPVGGPPGQGPYLNAVAELRTDRTPDALLQTLLELERGLGRVRAEKDGPRTIDLDLLFYDDAVSDDPRLTLPHPRLHERLFVLRPLAEVAPGLVHPVLQRTIADLLSDLTGVRPAGPSPGRELAGLRALVTGSTGGIGRAVALELAAAGADVIVHGRQSREGAEETADAVRRAGGRAEILLADLRGRAECPRLAAKAWEVWGGLDVCVNNAGADTLTGEAARWSFERKLEELLAVDVTATMLLSRALGRRMKEAGGGVVLNMGWDQADAGMEGDSGELFAAAKGAVMAFSKSLALSLAPEVRVHCLAPGWIRTAWGAAASEAWQERVRRETPLRRWGTPQDVAAAARWLASPAARYLTGQVVRVNGGAVR